MEEQVRGVLLEGDIADLVDDDQAVAAQPDLLGRPAAGMGVLKAGNPLDRGAEQDPVAGVSGFDAQADREVGFPGAGRSQQDDVARLVEEQAAGEVDDLVSCQRGLVVEDEVIESLPQRKPGRADAQLRARGVACSDFAVQDRGEAFLV